MTWASSIDAYSKNCLPVVVSRVSGAQCTGSITSRPICAICWSSVCVSGSGYAPLNGNDSVAQLVERSKSRLQLAPPTFSTARFIVGSIA